MFSTMLHHGTLIIAFTFAFSTLSQRYSWWGNGEKLKQFCLSISLLAGILSVLLLMDPFILNGLLYDLRGVPIIFIAYLLGGEYGLVSAILPTAYRVFIGGPGTLVGVVVGTVMPLVVGVLMKRLLNPNSTPFQLISYKKILGCNLVFCFVRGIAFWYMVDLTFQEWESINLNLTIFSFISLWGMAIMFNYFTKTMTAEAKLRESEARYRKLVSLMPDGLGITNNGEYVYVNDKLADILGMDSTEELIGRRYDELVKVQEEYVDIIEKREQQVREGEAVPFLERQVIRHDGEHLNVEVAAAPFIEKNQRFMLSIIRDVTQEKKAEMMRRKLEESVALDKLKTEFFSNISHELKTPLNIILGTIQLANVSYVENKGYEHFHKHMGIMKQNCFRLLRLINNLIDITRLESGFLMMQFHNYDIVKVVEDITISVAKYIENYGINVVFDTEVEEKYLACDADKIERIMLNLLSNAIKFTKPGGSIHVNIFDKEEEISISVKDTGIGIPKEKLETIFDRFQQVESTLKMNLGGSGIGLSLVKSLVENHKGTISVKSKENQGAEFTINLPVQLLEEDYLAFDEVAATEQSNVERIYIEFSDIYS